jgi:nucleoside-diphosphate-sugar epimerase
MNRILVIGGTGNVGRQVVDQLAATGARFRAMTRNPEAAGLPAQVEVVRGDLTIPETLNRCLQDIDTVFLVWVAPRAAAAARWSESRSTHGASCSSLLLSKRRTRSSNSPILPET